MKYLLSTINPVVSGPPLAGRLRVTPVRLSIRLSVCPFVPCLSFLLNVPPHHCTGVPFNM